MCLARFCGWLFGPGWLLVCDCAVFLFECSSLVVFSCECVVSCSVALFLWWCCLAVTRLCLFVCLVGCLFDCSFVNCLLVCLLLPGWSVWSFSSSCVMLYWLLACLFVCFLVGVSVC